MQLIVSRMIDLYHFLTNGELGIRAPSINFSGMNFIFRRLAYVGTLVSSSELTVL